MTDYQYQTILGLISLAGISILFVNALFFFALLDKLSELRKLIEPQAPESPKGAKE
jgi:hypothetical protein